jgi:hypothetical protein
MANTTIPCRTCLTPFTDTDADRAFRKNIAPKIAGTMIDLPPPTLCVDCREQRRLAIANQLFLYKRTCDLTGEPIISNIHPDSPYKVYRQDVWHSDKWDPLSYGRDVDFSRAFFEQWQELSLAVPRPNLFTGYQYDENAEYTNHAGKNKDCYMIFDSDENRDCYYCYSINGSQNCMECFRVRKSELCYGCIDSLHCYNSVFLQDCENCSDSAFLKNCTGCRNCLMSSNLKNKEYHVENKKVTKVEFERVRAMLTNRLAIDASRERFERLSLEYPQKYLHGIQNENVLGDYLMNCKNAQYCFDSADLWDCRYVFQGFMPCKDTMDVQECGDAERVYECAFVGYGANSIYYSTHILGSASDIFYSAYCPHSKNLFGCLGLRHKEYCILNKQYSKEEYEALVPKIIEHMRRAGEWGEFFPIPLSYAAYNETLAQDYYPLTKEEGTAKGYRWRESDPKTYAPATAIVPDDIAETKDEIIQEMFACASCKKNYRIIAQELALYRQMRLPLPTHCFECRLKEKRQKRNPRKLWDRKCGKCQKPIQTTYQPSRPEIVYCESCYLETVY